MDRKPNEITAAELHYRAAMLTVRAATILAVGTVVGALLEIVASLV